MQIFSELSGLMTLRVEIQNFESHVCNC